MNCIGKDTSKKQSKLKLDAELERKIKGNESENGKKVI